jgi:hypothetical protein
VAGRVRRVLRFRFRFVFLFCLVVVYNRAGSILNLKY